ncbi:DUF732 domain-containing protein [Streptomyces kronopolitis]|uniref:DUF732 domain-containing protein n=1 Tax=Streptomyces kronopolitis TaxID=1612435 RepID=UPI0020BE3394|nr:DUF732 domain-containing protein [Streptomyces kronopolitis]MCL6299834.1 DUF732 domain-containing protein [Streptomyces kronopolitis]
MRVRTAAICAALLIGATGCSQDSPAQSTEKTPRHPTLANYVGRTKGDVDTALGPEMTLRAFQDATTKADRSGAAYDSWTVCKQHADGTDPIVFTVAATRADCELPAASQHLTTHEPSSPADIPTSDGAASTTDKDNRFARAVKIRAPELQPVDPDDLGVQGQLVCTELDAGESPKDVLQSTRAAFPGEKGLAIVTEAPPVYCPSHSGTVKTDLK